MASSGVPKFSSFKAKPKKTAEPPKSEEKRSERHDNHRHKDHSSERRLHGHKDHRERPEKLEDSERDRIRHRDRNRHDRKHDHRPHDGRHRDRMHDVEQRVKKELTFTHRTTHSSAASGHPHQLHEDSEFFLVDTTGDPKNVEYGGLHRYSIPSYHRSGYGKVIGLSTRYRIDRDASPEKEVSLINVRKAQEANAPRLLTSRYGRPKEGHYCFISQKSGPEAEQIRPETDYIDLSSSQKRKRGSQSPALGVDYRSIEGKAKSQSVDDDLASASDLDVEDHDQNLDLAVRQHSASLSKQTKTSSQDPDSWRALVEYQAKLVNPGKDLSIFTSSERRTLADLRLSILREAMTNISFGHPGHEQLLLMTIEEGAFVWDSSKRAQTWKEALQKCPTSILLWTQYLNYVQDSHSSFRYEVCKDAYMKCLHILGKAAAESSGERRQSIHEVQIYVLLRLTAFIRQTGYIELSIAVWQALLEWCLQRPPSLEEMHLYNRLAAFEDFWDSECPRIGEQDASGWSIYYTSGATANRTQTSDPDTEGNDLFPDRRIREEAEWSGSLCLSTTADDDAAVEDPFRYVMFSDVREVLETCDCLSRSSPLLVYAALFFFGLPAPSSSTRSEHVEQFRQWNRDPHLARIVGSGIDGVALRSQHETAYSLFEQKAIDVHPSATDLVDRLLEQILGIDFDEGLAELFLAYRSRYFPTRATKAAKQLLKLRPSSLRLYNAYALLHVYGGDSKNLQKALEVWSTAIHMRKSLSEDVQDDVVLLWHTRLLCLAKRDPSGRAAQSSLMAICESTGDSSLQLLKVTRELESGFDRMQLAGKAVHATAYADLLACLAYYTHDSKVEGALEVYEKYAKVLSGSGTSAGLELLLQHKANLIWLHLDHRRTHRPALLRGQVTQDLERCPSNSVLLSLQSRLSASDRIRELFLKSGTLDQAKVVDTASTVISSSQVNVICWTHRLAHELDRSRDSDTSGVTNHIIRSRFRNTIFDPDSTIKHSPVLWSLWLQWEASLLRHGKLHDHHRNKEEGSQKPAVQTMKQVVLDGMRYIPWDMGFVVKGMEALAPYVPRGEVRQWCDVLVERGLRVRGSLEKAVE